MGEDCCPNCKVKPNPHVSYCGGMVFCWGCNRWRPYGRVGRKAPKEYPWSPSSPVSS